MDDEAHLKEFFSVPYFSTCVHVPPPPANQLAYVTLDKPIPVPEMWTSYWLLGELAVEISKNEMADSAYTMKEATLHPYEG